jgi:hypothetical protein
MSKHISTEAVRAVLRSTDRAQRNDGDEHVNDLMARMQAYDRTKQERARWQRKPHHGRATNTPARKGGKRRLPR